ncbi:MAG: hypothetical protein U5J97_10815 [Trueperaceae bacterium]|nr:hypothetical protein [Trueperaceae bacterium]
MRRSRVPLLPAPASTVYLVHAAVTAFAFAVMATLSSVYRFQVVGLTPLQLVLVGTVLEGTVLLAELPTGILADTVSRRLSLLVGTMLIGVGFVLEGLVPMLAAVLLAQVIWGSGRRSSPAPWRRGCRTRSASGPPAGLSCAPRRCSRPPRSPAFRWPPWRGASRWGFPWSSAAWGFSCSPPS